MMWPMWKGPFAYGSAVVTNSLRERMRDGDFSLDFKHVRE
jgi:hypothetical protein